jgi:hypothetical protein
LCKKKRSPFEAPLWRWRPNSDRDESRLLVLIALAPVVQQRLPARHGAAMLLAWPVRSLLLGHMVLSSGRRRSGSHVLSGLAHVPLAAVALPAGPSSAAAEGGIVALAEILPGAFLLSLLVALRRARVTARLLSPGLRGTCLLAWCSALALLGLAGSALGVFSLPFLPAWLLAVLALLLGPHSGVGATWTLPPVIASSLFLWLLLDLPALVVAPFLLLISPLGLFLFLCGFTWHFVLSFHYLSPCCSQKAGEAIG